MKKGYIMNYTDSQIMAIVAEAKSAAATAANDYFQSKLGGQDAYCCGFAWVDIHGIRANSKIGKSIKNASVFGIRQIIIAKISIQKKWELSQLPKFLKNMVSVLMLVAV
jgi:hypothetical protein